MSDRYSRQTILPEVGPEGQERLRSASVLVVGAGGLGCAALPYLCAAGVGHITIVDHDQVEESNLHRQPLYRMADLGLPKVEAARRALQGLNPEVRIECVQARLTPANVAELVQSATVTVDAADSFAVSYVLSDECRRVSRPLVSASALGLSGYVGSFCGGGPSYRAVFPDMPQNAGTCAANGVLGTAVAVMGSLQAHHVLALLLGWKPSVLGQLTTVDFRTLRMGGFSFGATAEPLDSLNFIAPGEVSDQDTVIDLRNLSETPVSPFPAALRISVDEIEQSSQRLCSGSRIVLCCRSGVRAWRAARVLQRRGYHRLALIACGE